MQVVQIICPGCKKKYKLKTPSVASMSGKQFNCPSCGFSVSFNMLIKNMPKDNPALHTHIAAQKSTGKLMNSPETQLHSLGKKGGASIVVDGTGRSFPLAAGIYILGRDSSDSKATLRIAPDPYMSRQHARLSVSYQMGGIQCQLCGLAASNPIFVNNKRLPDGGAVSLKHGDKILLGMTTITLNAI